MDHENGRVRINSIERRIIGRDDRETPIEKQVRRMVAFIELEGVEKAEGILSKAEEEYHVIFGSMVQAAKQEILDSYEKKTKTAAKRLIQQESVMYNQAKMVLQTAKNNFIMDTIGEVRHCLQREVSSYNRRYPELLKKLVLQALYLLKEPDVIVRVREFDQRRISGMLKDVEKTYKEMSGEPIKIKVAKTPLQAWTMGGVVIYNKRCTIKVTNTVYDRLRVILDHSLPMFRELLFGEESSRKNDASPSKIRQNF